MALTHSKQVTRQFEFESASRPGEYYSVLIYDDDSISCNCKGWIFSLSRSKDGKRFCKHTKEIEHSVTDTLMRGRTRIRNVQAQRSAQKARQEAGITVTTKVQVTVITRQKRMFDLEDE